MRRRSRSAGYARGLLAESHTRATHQARRQPRRIRRVSGATDAITQAAILGLYDPDRSQVIKQARLDPDLEHAHRRVGDGRSKRRKRRAARGYASSPRPITSPTLAQADPRATRDVPQGQVASVGAGGRATRVRAGSKLAFGKYVETRYRFHQGRHRPVARCRFLHRWSRRRALRKDWSSRRKAREDDKNLSRLYVVETAPTLAGAAADHRLDGARLRPSPPSRWPSRPNAASAGSPSRRSNPKVQEDRAALARDLKKQQGRSVVVAGEYRRRNVHALAHAINAALEQRRHDGDLHRPGRAEPHRSAGLARRSGERSATPARSTRWSSPAPTRSSRRRPTSTSRAPCRRRRCASTSASTPTRPRSIASGTSPKRISSRRWGDARAFDGTTSIVQPLIEPLYAGRIGHAAARGAGREARASRATTSSRAIGSSAARRRRLRSLLAPRAARRSRRRTAPCRRSQPCSTRRESHKARRRARGRQPDASWTSSSPRPHRLRRPLRQQRLAAGAAQADHQADLGQRRARQPARTALGLTDDEQAADDGDRSPATASTLEAPVWMHAGASPTTSSTLHLGYGRTRGGRVGNGNGFDAYGLRTANAPWPRRLDARARPRRHTRSSARSTTTTWKGAHIVHAGTTRASTSKDPRFAARDGAKTPPRTDRLYPGVEVHRLRLGDGDRSQRLHRLQRLRRRLPGGEQHPRRRQGRGRRGREMHWLRVDSLLRGRRRTIPSIVPPAGAVHALRERAVRAGVPGAATVAQPEGLNDMVYNRCVGTRYCSNNCPYKVRRFNFFHVSATPRRRASSCCAIPTSPCAAAA